MKRSAFLAMIGVAGLAPIAISGSGMQDGYKGMLVDLWYNKKLVGSGQIVAWENTGVTIEMYNWVFESFWNKVRNEKLLTALASDDLRMVKFDFKVTSTYFKEITGIALNVEVYYKWKQ